MENKKMILYHGSANIIEKPIFKGGSDKNDFGNGFYCTDDLILAKEWGATKDGRGFANEYEFDLSNISIFDLTKYDSFVWISVLLKNRDIAISSPLMAKNIEFLHKRYYPQDIEDADIVIGYRADDSYFTWAKDFTRNAIDIDQLEQAMNLNNLGLQYFIQSKQAFEHLSFVKAHEVEHRGYFNQRKAKESEANKKYMDILERGYSKAAILCSDLQIIDPIQQNNHECPSEDE